MPQAYCTDCDATVTVREGRCLLGHTVDPADIRPGRGRHSARRARTRRRRPLPPPPPPPPSSSPASPRPVPATAAPAPPRRGAASRLDPTGDLVAVMWDRDEAVELGAWATSETELGTLGRRRHRVGRWIVALFVLVAAAGGWWYVGEQTRRTTLRSAEAVATAAADLADLASELAPQVTDLAVVQADPRRRAELVTGLASLDAAARRLFDAAASLPAEDEGRIRLRASELARRAFSAEQSTADALAVAAALVPVTARPDLPSSVPPESLPDVAADLAWWITRVENTAPDLPADPRWEPLGAAVDELLARLAPFQETYLAALRTDDVDTATAAARDIDGVVQKVEERLRGILVTVGGEVAVELSDIASLSRDLAQSPR